MKRVVFDFHGVIYKPSKGGVNIEVLDIIKDLYSRGNPLYVFTNSPLEALKRRDQEVPFLQYFKEVVHQYSKPHAQSFEELFSRLDCDASEIVLVDDSRGVIEKAKTYGITAIQYVGASSLREGLEEILGESLDSEE